MYLRNIRAGWRPKWEKETLEYPQVLTNDTYLPLRNIPRCTAMIAIPLPFRGKWLTSEH
jgi:hypothetical protein